MLQYNESWDGTSWTEVGDLNTARGPAGGLLEQTSSAIIFGVLLTGGGYAGETWDGSSWTETNEFKYCKTQFLG